MEFTFARKGILENKKRFAMTFSVLVLCAFLLQFCSLLRDSLVETIIQSRFDAYGEFTYHLSAGVGENLAGKLDQNELIQDFGTLVQLGSAEVDIGTADEKALALGRIHLDMGRMPEGADEIALEPAVLLAHGCEAAPGQRIILEITGLLPPAATGVPPVAQVEFTVSGILHEYTSLWGFGLGGLVSEAGAERLAGYVGKHKDFTYLMAATAYPDIRSSQRNDKAYPKDSIENATALLSYAIWIIAGVSALILLVCMFFSVLKRRETWRFFRDLGAEKGQVQSIILWEGIFLGTVGLPLGAMLGLGSASALMHFAPSPAGDHWAVAFSPVHAAMMLGVAVLCTATGTILPSFLVRRVPLLPGGEKPKDKKYKRRKGNLGYLTTLRLTKERMAAQRGVTVVLFVMLCSCGVLGAFVIHTISYHTGRLDNFQQLAYNGEIIIDRAYDRINGMYDYYSYPELNFWIMKDFSPLDETTVEQIESLYGVESVGRYQIKLADYNRYEPQFNVVNGCSGDWDTGGRKAHQYDNMKYTSNRASPDFGGENSMLYIDLSPFEGTEYFQAFITGERARAARNLAYLGGWAHSVDSNFGKGMSYFDDNDDRTLQWDEMKPDNRYCAATVWGVEGDEAAPLLQAAEGTVDLDAYLRGEECVLVLPDIYFASEEKETEPRFPPVKMGYDIMAFFDGKENRDIGFYDCLRNCLFNNTTALQGYKIFQENAVSVGDSITISYVEEDIHLRVGAVLRQLPEDAAGYPASTLGPFTVITGREFFHRFEGFTCPDSYECVTVKLNSNQSASVVEMQIKEVLKPLNNSLLVVSNLVSTRQSLEQDAWASISTLALFGVLYLVVVLVVLSIIFSISMESNRKRVAVLRALGLEAVYIRMSYLLECICYSGSGFLAALPLMLTAWGIAQADSYGTGEPWLSYVFSEGCTGFLWWAYGLLFLAVTVGVICTLYMPLRRFFKESILEQMQS